MHRGNQATYTNAQQVATIAGDYTSVIADDNQQVNHLEGNYLTPVSSFRWGKRTTAGSKTPVTSSHEDHQEGGQVSIETQTVPQQTHCKQPPCWAVLLIVIGLGVIILPSVGIVMLTTGNMMPYNEVKTAEPKDCQEVYENGHHTSGVYRISPDCETQIDVYCDQQLDGGGWVVFQSRYNGSVDFYNDWDTYKAGFGNLMGEFWLGNENIYKLTKHRDQQLKVELVSPDGEVAFADYGYFFIDNESQMYRLNIANYSGATIPGDSLAKHNGHLFSTKDQDHDNDTSVFFARAFHGAWWFGSGATSNLNGKYGAPSLIGLLWIHWMGPDRTMNATRMMMRRTRP